MDNHHKSGYTHEHEHTLFGELMCHLPYAIFSVAFGLSVVSFLSYFTILGAVDPSLVGKGARTLFHSFHFMHIVFAATGALITYFRFSKNIVGGMLVGLFSATVFCTLSDAIIPYLAGKILGVHMHYHLCFLHEYRNILPFLLVGLLNGFVMSKHESGHQGMFSIFSHFVHILISSFASIFYLIGFGFSDWHHSIGAVFLFLIVAVVLPCTLSDVVVPMLCAQKGKRNAQH